MERQKQANDLRHPMYRQMVTISRLKSRKNFLRVCSALENDRSQSRINAWKDKQRPLEAGLNLRNTPGHELQWYVWQTLNRLWLGVGRSKDNIMKWGYLNDQDASCHCGTTQMMTHLLICSLAPRPCTLEYLTTDNQNAKDVVQY